jgi:hypothetical protein
MTRVFIFIMITYLCAMRGLLKRLEWGNQFWGMTMATAAEVLARAEKFNMDDIVDRYAEETRLPTEVVREHKIELLRFLSLCATSDASYGMRGPIDEFWHTFIIFTEKYQNFCEKVAGGFIHHFPIRHTDKGHEQPPVEDSYQRFLKDYKAAYGREAPPHIWPRPLPGPQNTSCNKCGSACDHKCYA